MRECTICQKDDDCKSLDLYVVGSEGTQVCTSCELAIVDFITAMKRVAIHSRKRGYLDCKAIRESKEKMPDFIPAEDNKLGVDIHLSCPDEESES